jgi:guanylate kinase
VLKEMAKQAMKPKPFLMVLSAPSGGGKTTLCGQLLKRQPWLRRCVTATTRAPRRGEKNGRDYWFLSEFEFKARVKADGFFEWARVHGHYYGTPRREVERSLKVGQSLVLVIDVQGGRQVKKKSGKAVLVFLLPPSLRALEKRLQTRGQDAPAMVARRLKNAVKEVEAAKYYDYVVVNDRLPQALGHVEDIAKAARWRQA